MFTDNDGTDMRSAFKDEQQNYSTARILLWIWTVVIIGFLVFKFELLADSTSLLTFFSGVYLYLATWCAGSRMAQYIAPQLGAIISGIGQSKIKDPGISSDVSEIVSYQKSKTLTKG